MMAVSTADADSTPGGGDEQAGPSWLSGLGSFASRARTAAMQAVPRSQELTIPLASASAPSFDRSPDGTGAEADDEDGQPRWAAWAKHAAERVRQQAVDAAGQAQLGISRGVEKAKSVDWSEQVREVQGSVARGLERVSEASTTAGSSFQDRVAQSVERAKSAEWAENARESFRNGTSRSFELVSESRAAVSSTASALQERSQASLHTLGENATAAAGAARGALSAAGERASGAASVAMNPAKLAQFFGIFFVGSLFIMLSINFLPLLPIMPQKFALFFTVGSLTMLSSFVVLSGIKSFAGVMARRDRLPFSVLYVVGLFGTLWATIIRRSYVFTSIFAIMQAIALLYFVCSSIPGGRTGLNAMFRLGARSARTLVQV